MWSFAEHLAEYYREHSFRQMMQVVVEGMKPLKDYNNQQLVKVVREWFEDDFSGLNQLLEDLSELEAEIAVEEMLKPKLSDELRKKITNVLVVDIIACRFGDGQEREHVLGGADWVGLDDMDDQQLIEEAESYWGSDDELLLKAKAQLAIEEMLSEPTEEEVKQELLEDEKRLHQD